MSAGLKEILAATGDIEVRGEATNGHEVLEAIRAADYDIVVLDMSMPGRSGIELIKLVKAERPKLRVLVLSMHSDEGYVTRALQAGATGYMLKDSAGKDLLKGIASVAAGQGAVAHEGRMIDEPIAVRARRFLQRHDALQARRDAARQQAAS